MEGYPEVGVTDGDMASEWGAHIATHQAEGVKWDPLTGYSAEQLHKNATGTQTTGEGVYAEPVEPIQERKPGEREFGPATRVLSPAQIVSLGKPVVHSAGEQPEGDDDTTHKVPGGVIDSF